MAQQAIRASRDDQGRPWIRSFSLNSSRTRAVADDKVAPSLSRSVSDPVAQAEYDRISEGIWLAIVDNFRTLNLRQFKAQAFGQTPM